MKTEHTPGPWQIFWDYGQTDAHRIYKGQSAEIVETIATVNAFAPTDGDMEAEAKANARLIAAAPELLEALRVAETAIEQLTDLMREDDFERDYGAQYRTIQSAIAKATQP